MGVAVLQEFIYKNNWWLYNLLTFLINVSNYELNKYNYELLIWYEEYFWLQVHIKSGWLLLELERPCQIKLSCVSTNKQQNETYTSHKSILEMKETQWRISSQNKIGNTMCCKKQWISGFGRINACMNVVDRVTMRV